MNPIESFENEKHENIRRQGEDLEALSLARRFMARTAEYKYSYAFSWMGVPIIQFPQDMVAMQEILWRVKPDVLIETGIAHGGSLIYYASLMSLFCGPDAKVLGIDIEIREHNRARLDAHPMRGYIELIEGSSTDPQTVARVSALVKDKTRVLVSLDSNHTHDHVLAELRAYAPLVTPGSYCVVFDTLIEDLPEQQHPNRPWKVGDNPKTAVAAYLKETADFEADRDIDKKLLITVAPGGFLRRVR